MEVILPEFLVLTVCLSLAIAALVFALLRERRIRTALQCLLSRILSQRRPAAHENTDDVFAADTHHADDGL